MYDRSNLGSPEEEKIEECKSESDRGGSEDKW